MAWDGIWKDLRYAARNLRSNPLFAGIAIGSLALGIGANTAIFTLLDQLLLRPLPVKAPQELVQLDLPGARQGATFNNRAFSYPMFQDLRARTKSLSGLAGQFQLGASFAAGERSEVAGAMMVTGNWFEVMGLGLAAGRGIQESDTAVIDGGDVVVLSHGFWQRRFASDPGVLNRSVRINGQAMTVIGVAAKEFRGTDLTSPPDLFVPVTKQRIMMPNWYGLENRRFFFLNLFGRRKPGVSLAAVKNDLDQVVVPILEMELKLIETPSKRFSESFLAKRFLLFPAATGNLSGQEEIQTALWVLAGLVGAVLLIACANVASLLLARATGRRKEMAVRMALGASRWQVMRMLLAESFLLALAGSVVGLLAGAWAMQGLLGMIDPQITRSITGIPDGRVLLFTAALALLTGLVFGFAPAVSASGTDAGPALKEEGNSVSGAGIGAWARKALVAGQLALSVVLLAAAWLFLSTLDNLRKVDPGFDKERLLAFQVNPALNGYKPAAAVEFSERLRRELSLLPGVNRVSMAAEPMMADSVSRSTVRVAGYQPTEGEDMNPMVNAVGPEFVSTVGIRLLQGREIHESDALNSPKVAVVNESFVKRYYKGESPLGRKIGFARRRDPDMTIVGVMRDFRHAGQRQEEDLRMIFIPSSQDEEPNSRTYYLRTAMAPETLGPAIRQLVRRMDANLPVENMRTMEQQMDLSLRLERMVSILCGSFGLLATLLASVGLYGVMAFYVARRTREIGIRMALGAERRSVVGMVMREAGWLVGVGLLAGVPAAIALGKYAESLLYQVRGGDPKAAALAAAFLALVALAASFVPARRAAGVSPMRALRYE